MKKFDEKGKVLVPDLEETIRRADALDMSYGNYVASNGIVYRESTRRMLDGLDKVCENCGCRFRAQRSCAKYCSDYCRFEAFRKRRLAENNFEV